MASEKNPVEEFLDLKKVAGPRVRSFVEGVKDVFGMRNANPNAAPAAAFHHIGQAVATGGALAAGSAAMAGASIAAQKLYDAATKGRDFRKMLEYNQDLVEHHQNDPKTFNQMFSTLRTFNPSFSRDPLVSGNIMKTMLENPNNVASTIQVAMGTQGPPHPVETITRAVAARAGAGHPSSKKPSR